MLLMTGLPMCPLAFFAAVEDESTPGTARKRGSTLIPFGRGAVAADLTIGFSTFLVYLLSQHAGWLNGEYVSSRYIY